MNHIVIGTAGHIDHGKTALIKALTGRNTDTQKEEKQRGITIDLGFTYFDLPSGERAGIIDVPGHEKFLPNMLAGVCGMDLVLLTIALDEGIMPQTREHLDILEQLNIQNGIVVLTKLDMVEKEWADMMEEEIREELKNRIFSKWPMIQVSTHEGTGIPQLQEMLCDMTSQGRHNRETNGHFRMPIDRIFSVKGMGTVIAGTVLEGSLSVDQEIIIYPEGIQTKIRGIQCHGNEVTEVTTGQRAALLVPGVAKQAVCRGMVAAYADSIRPTTRLDVTLSISADCKRIIKNQSRVHLHIGSDEVIARVILLDQQQLMAGQEGYAQLITEREVCVKRNDRFVIRFFSPLETLGGGMVLKINASKHKRMDESVLQTLKQRKDNRQEQLIISVINESLRQPIGEKALADQVQMFPEEFEQEKERLQEEKTCLILKGKKQNYYWSFQSTDVLMVNIQRALSLFHQQHPYRRGMRKSLVKANLFKGMEPLVAQLLIDYLIENQVICGVEDFIWLKDFEIIRDETFENVKQIFLDKAHEAGYSLYDFNKEDYPKVNDSELEDIVEAMIEFNEIIQIHDTLFTTRAIANDIIKKVVEYFQNEEILSFASLRDLLEVSRKASKPMMAFLDEEKVTVWCGKETERKKNPLYGKSIE